MMKYNVMFSVGCIPTDIMPVKQSPALVQDSKGNDLQLPIHVICGVDKETCKQHFLQIIDRMFDENAEVMNASV